MSKLVMRVGDIWLRDTTKLYGKFGDVEHWLILETGTANEMYRDPYYWNNDYVVRYLNLGTGEVATKNFKAAYNDMNGNPYFKLVA